MKELAALERWWGRGPCEPPYLHLFIFRLGPWLTWWYPPTLRVGLPHYFAPHTSVFFAKTPRHTPSGSQGSSSLVPNWVPKVTIIFWFLWCLCISYAFCVYRMRDWMLAQSLNSCMILSNLFRCLVSGSSTNKWGWVIVRAQLDNICKLPYTMPSLELALDKC